MFDVIIFIIFIISIISIIITPIIILIIHSFLVYHTILRLESCLIVTVNCLEWLIYISPFSHSIQIEDYSIEIQSKFRRNRISNSTESSFCYFFFSFWMRKKIFSFGLVLPSKSFFLSLYDKIFDCSKRDKKDAEDNGDVIKWSIQKTISDLRSPLFGFE